MEILIKSSSQDSRTAMATLLARSFAFFGMKVSIEDPGVPSDYDPKIHKALSEEERASFNGLRELSVKIITKPEIRR